MPTNVTYFICGFRISTNTTISIAPTSSMSSMPDLSIVSSSSSPRTVYPSSGTWSTTLTAQDHILRIEGPDDDRWPGATVTLGASTTFVTRPVNTLRAWSAASAAGDQKDPWPPPPGTLISIASTAWFTTTFGGITVTLPRSM